MKKLFVIAIAASVALGAFAEWDAWEDASGETWSYTVSHGNAYITGVSLASGEITIPSVVNGYPVIGIWGSAFYNCSGLTSVTIPNSVTSIGWGRLRVVSGLLA